MGILTLITITLVIGIGIGFTLGFSRAMRQAAARIQRENQDPVKRTIASRLMLMLGTACLVIALCVAIYTWHFIHISRRTSGTVIEMLQNRDKDGDISYSPTFRFEETNGTPHIVSSHVFSSPPEFHVGDSVSILYPDDRPQAARIDRYSQIWGLPTVIGIAGGLLVIFGLGVKFWPKLKGRLSGKVSTTSPI